MLPDGVNEFPESTLSCLNCAYWVAPKKGDKGICKFNTEVANGAINQDVLQFEGNAVKIRTPKDFFCESYSVGSTNVNFGFSRWYSNYIDELSRLTGEVYALTAITKEKAERCKTLFYDQRIRPKDAAKLTRLAMAMLGK